MTRYLAILALLSLGTAAWATSQILVPVHPTGESVGTIGTALNMACGRFTATNAITAATKIAGNVRNAYGGGKKITWTVYVDLDLGVQIATTGPLDGSTTGPKTATGLSAFDIGAGTTYRLCACATSNLGSYAAPAWTATTGTAALQNAFVTSVGIAANVCDASGNAPSSTGAITADTTVVPPILVLEN